MSKLILNSCQFCYAVVGQRDEDISYWLYLSYYIVIIYYAYSKADHNKLENGKTKGLVIYKNSVMNINFENPSLDFIARIIILQIIDSLMIWWIESKTLVIKESK
jgi:hypothetical protein